jgi:hypothetical protein
MIRYLKKFKITHFLLDHLRSFHDNLKYIQILLVLLLLWNFVFYFRSGNLFAEISKNGISLFPSIENIFLGSFFAFFIGLLYPVKTLTHNFHWVKEFGRNLSDAIVLMKYLPEFFTQIINHFRRDYPKTALIGWNIFIDEPHTHRRRLFIPTEDFFSLEDLFADDHYLYSQVLNDVLNTHDFIVEFSDNHRKDETMRRVKNMISKAVKSSQWPKYAHLHKNYNRNDIEKALILLTYERDAPVKMTRIWLIFPEELRMLLQYQHCSDDELRKAFHLEMDHWILRIKHLIHWAQRHYIDNIPSDRVDLPIILV